MDPSAVQFPMDPVASAEAPRSGELAPGKKRGDKAQADDAGGAAAAALTVSFADILRSRKLDIKTGLEEKETRETKEPLEKTKPAGRKDGGGASVKAIVLPAAAAAGKQLRQPAVEVQAKETWDHAKDAAGQAMKAAPAKTIAREVTDALQAPALPKQGVLSAPEEGLLREMIQKNGNVTGRKKAAQMMGFVNGEPLNRREGINAVKSMTAKEGEVLKILSGGEEASTQPKAKTARQAKPQQAFVVRDDASEGYGKLSHAALSADKAGQGLTGPSELAQDKLAQPVQGKKQGGAAWSNPELREVAAGPSTISALQERGIDNPTPARPQAVMSQVLDGAAQILRDGSGRMVLTLQPPRLGTLDLDVVVQDNRVKMVMLADNQEVKQMLQAGMDDLRNALQDKGFEIDRLEVLVQNRPDEAGSDFWREAGFSRGDSREGEQRKPGRDPDSIAQGAPVRPLRTGDGGLSVFA